VATIACWASPNGPRTFSTQCDEVAATLALVNASAFPLGPNAAYARQVSAAFKRLDGAIATPLSQLKAARTPSAQAAAATQLSKAYTTAASSLSHATVSPMDADVQGSLLSALRGISSGYARAAAAAHAGSSAGFKSASHAIDASSSALSKALRTLGSRGYHVGK
jgi:hypothetical protein